eukprot:CAMPEP_0172373526 /NCGR_PEP_ID=MMETSP1060-20121228/52010_1 /TAXON_ID=37318 /ORGANISM="Pseudo-nitzschia pungens, Strain cf. cingulata" /LENGTH=346 /DNA_ID=CAMNT_0013099885 /DNA_START=27 /DNA_END=1067 /DNA_ORIENTATION=+
MSTLQRLAFFLLLSTSANGFSTSSRSSIRLPTPLAASTVMDESPPASVNEAVAETVAKSWDDDGFVFGLEGSGLERPKGKVAQIVVEGDYLESTNTQRAVVWSTLVGHAGICVFSAMGMLEANQQALGSFAGSDELAAGLTAAQATLLVVSSWMTADLGSGVLHWSVDNYGNGKTPIMGGLIAAFQGHHSAPWTICEREFENNVYKLCIPFGIQTVLAMKFALGLGHASVLFWSVFCTMEIMSQEMHKMSHTTKKEAGPIWNALQDAQLSIDRKSHAQHHIAPYDGNYCIVNGRCNKFLDESGFFRRLEHIVYKINGVESNAWKLDAKLRERTLQGDYSLPKKAAQ